jgi:hypothetical protein
VIVINKQLFVHHQPSSQHFIFVRDSQWPANIPHTVHYIAKFIVLLYETHFGPIEPDVEFRELKVMWLHVSSSCSGIVFNHRAAASIVSAWKSNTTSTSISASMPVRWRDSTSSHVSSDPKTSVFLPFRRCITYENQLPHPVSSP